MSDNRERKDEESARFRGFLSEKLRSNPGISLILAVLIAIFFALLAWLFII